MLERGQFDARQYLDRDEVELVKSASLLSLKPVIYVKNIGEGKLGSVPESEDGPGGRDMLNVSAKIESELSSLSLEDQKAYMEELGFRSSGLDRVIRLGYEILGLITFFTPGPKEVHAWTIKQGMRAPTAAGEVHTDFERGFISAEVINSEKLFEVSSYKSAKDKGLIRLEGKSYVMEDGDIALFRFSV